MGILTRFGDQGMQQPLTKSESKRSENVKSKSVSETNTHEYRDENEMMEQLKLWRDADKIEQWNDDPAKVKVTYENGKCYMDMEFTLGLPPLAAYDVLTNPDDQAYSRLINEREILENVSRKVLSTDGPRQVVESEKAVAWNFYSLSGAIPITLVFDENQKDLSAVYMKKKMRFLKIFEGSWKVEPIYVDAKHLCKDKIPKSREEYRKCSGGKGRIGSQVTMDQLFQPSSLFNLPPFSWCIRRYIIKTTKILLQDLQNTAAMIRGV